MTIEKSWSKLQAVYWAIYYFWCIRWSQGVDIKFQIIPGSYARMLRYNGEQLYIASTSTSIGLQDHTAPQHQRRVMQKNVVCHEGQKQGLVWTLCLHLDMKVNPPRVRYGSILHSCQPIKTRKWDKNPWDFQSKSGTYSPNLMQKNS